MNEERRGLSGREIEILRLVALGKSNREIAGSLAITAGTVKSHLRRVFLKLKAANRTEAAVAWLRRGES